MSNLIIIGNGFDLHHGVKSTYNNFKEYLEQIQCLDFIESLERHCNTFKIDKTTGKEKKILWEDFENELGNLDIEEILDDKRCYLMDYCDEIWSDSFHHDYKYEIQKELKFTKDIESNLNKWIKSVDTNVKPKYKDDFISNDNFYISFNYTPLLTDIYNIDSDKVCYIHGKVGQDSLIFGHNQSDKFMISKGEERILYDLDVRVAEGDQLKRDYFKNTYKDVIKVIAKHESFFQELHQAKNIFIIGHSLSCVDLPYFKYLTTITDDKTNWIVSYHQESNKQELKDRLMSLGIENDKFSLVKTKDICGI